VDEEHLKLGRDRVVAGPSHRAAQFPLVARLSPLDEQLVPAQQLTDFPDDRGRVLAVTKKINSSFVSRQVV
jgi:hypothetical protein